MQSFDHSQTPGASDQYFQTPNQPRVSLPPASSFFESTQPAHASPSTPFHSNPPLVEPSNEPYIDPQYNQNYVDPNYPDYSQNYGNVYNPSDVRFNQMEMYPPPPIPMMQPPAPPEYSQGMMPQGPIMYPPSQFQQPQWNQNDFRQSQNFNQPMINDMRTFPNQNIGISQNQENNFVPNFQNPRMENYQQVQQQNFNQNSNFIPPHTTSEYNPQTQPQPQQPQYPVPQVSQVPQVPRYPDPRPRQLPIEPQSQPIPKSNDNSIADTVAEVIAVSLYSTLQLLFSNFQKQKAKIFEEEQEVSDPPISQPKKRRYVATLDPPYPEDGPTVKEHLKQKQMEKKIQEKQEILKQKILEDEEKRKVQTVETPPSTYPTVEEVVTESTFEHAVETQKLPQDIPEVYSEKVFLESEIDTEVAAKIEEIGGFEGSTVGELAESIEGVPGQSGRKRKKQSKPRKKQAPKVEVVQKENDEKDLFKALHLQNTVRSLVLVSTFL